MKKYGYSDRIQPDVNLGEKPPKNSENHSELYRQAALEWVDAEAAAELLEATKSAYLAERMAQQELLAQDRSVSIAAAERSVKASPEWRDYVEKMVAARRHANRCKVQLEYIRMKFWEQNSRDATQRAEMRM